MNQAEIARKRMTDSKPTTVERRNVAPSIFDAASDCWAYSAAEKRAGSMIELACQGA